MTERNRDADDNHRNFQTYEQADESDDARQDIERVHAAIMPRES